MRVGHEGRPQPEEVPAFVSRMRGLCDARGGWDDGFSRILEGALSEWLRAHRRQPCNLRQRLVVLAASGALAEPTTHRDLAHRLGVARENVCRELLAMEREGLVRSYARGRARAKRYVWSAPQSRCSHQPNASNTQTSSSASNSAR